MLCVGVFKYFYFCQALRATLFSDNINLISCIRAAVNTTLDQCLLAVHIHE